MELNFGQMAGDMPGNAGPDFEKAVVSDAPPTTPTQTYDVPGFSDAGPVAPDASKASLSDIANQIVQAGLGPDKNEYQRLLMGSIYRLRSLDLPETPPELAKMGMTLDYEGRPVPVEQFTSTVANDAMSTAQKIHSSIQKYQGGEAQRLMEVEQQTAKDFQDASTEARYGMPAEDVNALKAVIAGAAQHPEDDRVQGRAQDALARLSQAEQDVVHPKGHNVWADKSKFQSAMFIALNAMAGAMKAYGYQGPTPLEVAERVMDEDLQNQIQMAKNRDLKVDHARTAFEVASRRVQNAGQAELLARDLMWAPIEAEAKAAGLHEAVAEIQDKRLKNNLDYRTTALLQRAQKEAQTIPPLVQLYLAGERNQGATAWRGKNTLLTGATEKLNSLRTLQKFKSLWDESQMAGVGWMLGKVPGNITDQNVYEKLRRMLSIQIAAAKNKGRPNDKDAYAIYQALPSSGSVESGGKALIDYQINEAIREAQFYMAGVESSVGTPAVNELIKHMDESNPNVMRFIQNSVDTAAPDSGFKEGGE